MILHIIHHLDRKKDSITCGRSATVIYGILKQLMLLKFSTGINQDEIQIEGKALADALSGTFGRF